MTSDAAADTITLGVAGGFITVNGTATTLEATPAAEVVVNAGGGNDTVDASALGTTNYNNAAINGGEGDDLLTGGARNDLVEGGIGEDRVVGFKGNDVLQGGDGADVLVWNNGDASDRDEGGNGVDEVEVNGSPTVGDQFNAKPEAEKPGFVFFERSNLVKFSIESQAERLTVNGLGGEDQFIPDPAVPVGLAGLTALTVNGGSAGDRLVGGDGADQINGGSGTDELFGGEGADQINGGDENDEIKGNGGDDRIVGGTGSDSLQAEAGDDAIVWNNGDGSDPVNEGGAGFDRVEVNGSPAAGDLTQFDANATEASFVRTNLVAFTLEIAPDNEVLAFNGLGGNDAFKVHDEGSAMTVAADGGAGNDELSGADEVDSFFGGSGNDLLNGGAGSDLLDGQEGEDRMFARDGFGDLVRGGVGNDSAQTDRITVDAVDGVETLEATPAPVPTPGPKPSPRLRPNPSRHGRIDPPHGGQVRGGPLSGQAHRPRAGHMPGGRGGRVPHGPDPGDGQGRQAGQGPGGAGARIGDGQPGSRPEQDRLGSGQSGRRERLQPRQALDPDPGLELRRRRQHGGRINGSRPANPWSLGTTPPQGGGPAERGASSLP